MKRVDGTLLVLLWVARCDGPISRLEFAHLLSICLHGGDRRQTVDRLAICLRHMSAIDADDLLAALVAMGGGLGVESRKRLLQAAVTLAMVDVRAQGPTAHGSIMPAAAVHVLRFLADALSGGSDGLSWFSEACQRVGIRVPLAGDPSDPQWWLSLDAPQDPLNERLRVLTAPEVQRLTDLAKLGVPSDASDELITRTYRFMARVFHPDKVRGESPEIQQMAAQEFQRIDSAYRRLRSR